MLISLQGSIFLAAGMALLIVAIRSAPFSHRGILDVTISGLDTKIHFGPFGYCISSLFGDFAPTCSNPTIAYSAGEVLAEVTSIESYRQIYTKANFASITRALVLLLVGAVFAALAIALSLFSHLWKRWGMVSTSVVIVLADVLVFCAVFSQLEFREILVHAVRRSGMEGSKVEVGSAYGMAPAAFVLLVIGSVHVVLLARQREKWWMDKVQGQGKDDVESGSPKTEPSEPSEET